ncbi:hypothetical protein F5Y12DRAFT_777092 [Xylaria sp. FL1777]|nr:hypothetical protein F5Y12DRAFT_777092 [Xylaria sp. FL1777]
MKWRLADVEWREWLSGQAGSSADQLTDEMVAVAHEYPQSRTPRTRRTTSPGESWGPLPDIPSADIWWNDLS